MRNINTFLPMNCGSGNRGCEAIARGTSEILSLDKGKTFLYDFNDKEMALDLKLGLDSIGELKYYASSTFYSLAERAFHKAMNKVGITNFRSNIYPYSTLIKELEPDDLILLTGGDLYCYEYHLRKNTQFVMSLKKQKKGKIVLWGATIEPSLLNQESVEGLKALDKITVRESLSYEALINLGINKNVEQYSDPAFVLKPLEVELPESFMKSGVVGINVSNLVNGGFELNTEFSRNLIRLIEYILKFTDMQIMFIPHVTWKGQDDRIISNAIAKMFEESKRVHVLKMDAMSYQEIRYVISKCKFFLGGRTHSMISAYSTCVPSIALGYSIKSKGIARDLSLPEELVINCKKLTSDTDLLRAFEFLVENESEVRNTLSNRMGEYIQSSYAAKNALNGILY